MTKAGAWKKELYRLHHLLNGHITFLIITLHVNIHTPSDTLIPEATKQGPTCLFRSNLELIHTFCSVVFSMIFLREAAGGDLLRQEAGHVLHSLSLHFL